MSIIFIKFHHVMYRIFLIFTLLCDNDVDDIRALNGYRSEGVYLHSSIELKYKCHIPPESHVTGQ